MSADLFFLFSANIFISAKMYRKCKNNLDRFCYICSNLFFPIRQAKITDFVINFESNMGIRISH